jgi:hypothetical protein
VPDASRDLPTPLGPVTVTSPGQAIAAVRARASHSRPMNEVVATGTGATADAACSRRAAR